MELKENGMPERSLEVHADSIRYMNKNTFVVAYLFASSFHISMI